MNESSVAVPPFESALEQMRSFLLRQDLPKVFVWAFRDEVLQVTDGHILLAPADEASTMTLIQRVYEQGRGRGLVELLAFGRLSGAVVATVWFPRLPEDEVQGWSQGLTLSVLRPLREATFASRPRAAVMRRLPEARRLQRHLSWAGDRAWARA